MAYATVTGPYVMCIICVCVVSSVGPVRCFSLSDADFLCLRVTFTCQRDWACCGRIGGMGFGKKDLFLMTAVMMTTLTLYINGEEY